MYGDELVLKHALLESIEAFIDISTYIISVKDFRRPLDFLVLNKISSREFSEKLQLMSKFRNIIVHKYALVDKKSLLKFVKENV
ncbi:MAG: DUF86 domain-containing protein [Candidatus Aenigmarchaeota archaeon]|nr:DUF86 domain-containing protein [Candidatus Aenigmarchaeota archaeon]